MVLALRPPVAEIVESTTGEVKTFGNMMLPPGVVVPYAGSAAPAGWLLCDGAAVSRATYAALFAIIGVVYGAGDGSTTFNVPNYKGRVPVGVDAAQSEFDVVGEVGGAKTHTLQISEMPAHTHPVTGVGSAATGSATNLTGASDTSSTTATAGSTGGGQPHQNMPPYICQHYLIKT